MLRTFAFKRREDRRIVDVDAQLGEHPSTDREDRAGGDAYALPPSKEPRADGFEDHDTVGLGPHADEVMMKRGEAAEHRIERLDNRLSPDDDLLITERETDIIRVVPRVARRIVRLHLGVVFIQELRHLLSRGGGRP